MRKLRQNKWISIVMTILVVGATIAAFAIPELSAAILGGLAGVGGSVLATTGGPVSIRTIEDVTQTHLQRSVSDIVTEKKPAATPLDTLIRKIGKKQKTIHLKAEWQEVSVRGTEDTLTSGFTAAGNSTDESVALDVTNTEIWGVDDLARVPSVTGLDTYPLILHVTAVDTSADTITVTAVNGTNGSGAVGRRVLSITNGSKLYRIGNSKSELDAQTDERYEIPVDDYNYCQTFQVQLSESEFAAVTRSYSGYNYNDKKRLALWDFRSKMEMSHLFGTRMKYRVGNDDHYTAGGIANKISNSVEFGTGGGAVDPTVADVIDLCETVFAPNEGSERRFLFVGRTLLSAIDKIDTEKRRIEVTHEDVKDGNGIAIGLKVKKFITSHGELLIVPNKSLNFEADWQKKGIVVDMDHIIKQEFLPMKAVALELNKSGQSRVNKAFRIEETSCLQTRYAGAGGVHAIWEPQLST